MSRRRRRRPGATRSWLLRVGSALALLTLLATGVALGLFAWARGQRPVHPPSKPSTVEPMFVEQLAHGGLDERAGVRLAWPGGLELASGASLLRQAGLVLENPWFELYARLFSRGQIDEGVHWLSRELSVGEVVVTLERSLGRPRVRVNIPEGFNVFQIAARLANHGVVEPQAFLRLALSETPSGRPSFEGLLFPASYDFYFNSRPEQVIDKLGREMDRRVAALLAKHAAAFARLAQELGWQRDDVLTLASLVQAEGARPSEFPRIASVFWNRLTRKEFYPRRLLQSDPTAAYGCWLAGARLTSCRDFVGGVSPAMLRDAGNRYNTYRHAGLPPGPIGNPGETAIEAVLAPEASDYFYFVADGNGGHVFSQSLADHEREISDRRRVP